MTISASGANAGYLLYHLDDILAADCSYYQDENKLWFVYNTLLFLQPVISNLQCGAAQPHVYPKNINKIPVIIPEKSIMELYCEQVAPIYQRDLLLPRLMSGKLEV